MRYDLPASAGRLYAEARGVDHVLVNGEEIVTDGAFTEARPGTVLRGGTDTTTPSSSQGGPTRILEPADDRPASRFGADGFWAGQGGRHGPAPRI